MARVRRWWEKERVYFTWARLLLTKREEWLATLVYQAAKANPGFAAMDEYEQDRCVIQFYRDRYRRQ